jgi:carbamoyltransferase
MDVAASVQAVTEEIVLRMTRSLARETGMANLCMAGGVALNCVANGRIVRDGAFRNLWVQPAAGDAGGAIGAALAVWHGEFGNDREVNPRDAMRGAFIGPEFGQDEIDRRLTDAGAVFERVSDDAAIAETAAALADGKAVGWFQGRMEFGPRALGARSILADARSATMQKQLNLKVKFRESFRPFAPSVLAERVGDWFELAEASPYMLLVAGVRADRRLPPAGDERGLDVREWVNRPRSTIPAVTHVDYSARIQTVHADTNPDYHALIAEFERLTGCPVVVNTSFNVRGEPIVCTPEDAYRCFMRTEMDDLVLGPFLLAKADQPAAGEREEWRAEYALD